jgi:hypothetical protein
MANKLTTKNIGNVLSVDLASVRYRDFGFAYLEKDSHTAQIIKAEKLGLRGKPLPADLAGALDQYCSRNQVSVLLLDGPQGWKSPKVTIKHMRLCERVINTPGKTGEIGHIKPANYLRYVVFSISLFHFLRTAYGWSLLTEDWASRKSEKWIVECFPSKAWETLGLKRLPSKSKATKRQIKRWRDEFSLVTGLKTPQKLTHDELQAIAVLPLGRALAEGNEEQVNLSGMDPIITKDGDVLEGWIANPVLVH